MTKDPYLSELDALGDLPVPEEATDVNLHNPPVASEAPSPSRVNPEAFMVAQDLPVQLVVVMGRKGMTLKDLLDLKTGNVVELDRIPEEAVDLVANGKVIAKGELVEIDGKLGVRILKIIRS